MELFNEILNTVSCTNWSDKLTQSDRDYINNAVNRIQEVNQATEDMLAQINKVNPTHTELTNCSQEGLDKYKDNLKEDLDRFIVSRLEEVFEHLNNTYSLDVDCFHRYYKYRLETPEYPVEKCTLEAIAERYFKNSGYDDLTEAGKSKVWNDLLSATNGVEQTKNKLKFFRFTDYYADKNVALLLKALALFEYNKLDGLYDLQEYLTEYHRYLAQEFDIEGLNTIKKIKFYKNENVVVEFNDTQQASDFLYNLKVKYIKK
jgi:hypothetical protein